MQNHRIGRLQNPRLEPVEEGDTACLPRFHQLALGKFDLPRFDIDADHPARAKLRQQY